MINAANVIGLNPKDWQNSAEETRVVAESMQDEHADREVSAFRVAGRNLCGDAAYYVATCRDYRSGTVASRNLFNVQVRYAVGLAHDAMRHPIAEGMTDRRLAFCVPAMPMKTY
jgi:hypothetical protein